MAEGTVAADQLRLFIERIERLEEEKKGISDDVRDVYSEAKANGYDPKIMRMIVRLVPASSTTSGRSSLASSRFPKSNRGEGSEIEYHPLWGTLRNHQLSGRP